MDDEDKNIFLDSGQDDDDEDDQSDLDDHTISSSDDDEDDQVHENEEKDWEWQSSPSTTRQSRVSNIIRRPQGMMTNRIIDTRMTAFNSFISQDMKKIIVDNTNKFANKEGVELDLNEEELDAWIAILLVQGMTHQSKTAIDDLWKQTDSLKMQVFSETMSRNRFKSIINLSDSMTRRQEEQDKRNLMMDWKPFDL